MVTGTGAGRATEAVGLPSPGPGTSLGVAEGTTAAWVAAGLSRGACVTGTSATGITVGTTAGAVTGGVTGEVVVGPAAYATAYSLGFATSQSGIAPGGKGVGSRGGAVVGGWGAGAGTGRETGAGARNHEGGLSTVDRGPACGVGARTTTRSGVAADVGGGVTSSMVACCWAGGWRYRQEGVGCSPVGVGDGYVVKVGVDWGKWTSRYGCSL